jgi:putative SOS response-associated peptidase YedK
MCGKFTQLATWKDVVAFSRPLVASQPRLDEVVVSTPMREANIVRLDAGGQRELAAMRWGFAGKDDPTPSRPKHMHARCETIDKLQTFRRAFAEARGILMVHTFNEGEELPNGRTKQWVITPKDGLPIALAVICEEWTNGTQSLQTFVQVTTPANPLISRITDRMPAVLPRDTWPTWLGETDTPLSDVKGLLQTFDDGGNWTMAEQPRPPGKGGTPPRQPSLF